MRIMRMQATAQRTPGTRLPRIAFFHPEFAKYSGKKYGFFNDFWCEFWISPFAVKFWSKTQKMSLFLGRVQKRHTEFLGRPRMRQIRGATPECQW